MRAARIACELDLAVGLFQRHEHLLTLTDWAAVIGLTLHDQRRGLRAMRECRRRVGSEGFTRLVRLAAPLIRAPGMRDVAGAVHRLQVEARSATHGGLEAVSVADRPGRHEAAVAVTPDAGALRLEVRSLERRMHDRPPVTVTLAAPVEAHLLRELAAVRAGAAWVGQHDHEAMTGEGLLDGVEAVPVVAVRPAVYIEDDGIFASRIEIGRFEQPGLGDKPVALDVEALPARRRSRLKQGAVEPGRQVLLTGLTIVEDRKTSCREG